jgi:predicted transcriptional regulator of viral defense system
MQVNLSMTPSIDKSHTATLRKARALLQTQRGAFRTGEALKAGIHPRTLYMMRDQKIIERLGRGMYRFADMPSLRNPDLATVAMKITKGVICLISALSYHELTTEIPHEIYIALPRGAEPPRLDYPPLRIFWFSGSAFTEGIEQREVDGIPVKVYNPEKTLADCFKYRNKIGLDVFLEALKFYRQRKRFQADDLMHFARVCRVEKIMRPYLEAAL